MQNVDLRNKSYKQLLVITDSGAARKKIIVDFFVQLKFFFLFFVKHLNISMSSRDSEVTYNLEGKISKFTLGQKKIHLDECSSTSKKFLAQYIHVFTLVSLCYI